MIYARLRVMVRELGILLGTFLGILLGIVSYILTCYLGILGIPEKHTLCVRTTGSREKGLLRV